MASDTEGDIDGEGTPNAVPCFMGDLKEKSIVEIVATCACVLLFVRVCVCVCFVFLCLSDAVCVP